jgi:hypothetical protein
LIGRKLARGSLEAFVDRVALAPVLFTYPMCKPPFILLDDVHAFIRASAIYDNVLNVGIALKQNRSNGFFQELSLIV